MHPDNKHHGKYDLIHLCKIEPNLKKFLKRTPSGKLSLDFTNPKPVKLLNTALLKTYYDLKYWDFPTGHLCPPIPGRADYIHYLNDLISTQKNPHKPKYILDIGTGASVIYPILGCKIYGWQFKASEINKLSLQNAKKIIEINELGNCIKLSLQKKTKHILKGIILPEEKFTASICNPPFYSTAEEAKKANLRKNKALKLTVNSRNFEGLSNELWTEGGEIQFIKNYIKESFIFKNQVEIFTTLVAYNKHLPVLIKLLKQYKVKQYKVIQFGQGQKQSQILTWQF